MDREGRGGRNINLLYFWSFLDPEKEKGKSSVVGRSLHGRNMFAKANRRCYCVVGHQVKIVCFLLTFFVVTTSRGYFCTLCFRVSLFVDVLSCV